MNGWVYCCQCGTPQPICHPASCMGASEVEPGHFLCNNGRDCALRRTRKLRPVKQLLADVINRRNGVTS